jgi:hypothetical protein
MSAPVFGFGVVVVSPDTPPTGGFREQFRVAANMGPELPGRTPRGYGRRTAIIGGRR